MPDVHRSGGRTYSEILATLPTPRSLPSEEQVDEARACGAWAMTEPSAEQMTVGTTGLSRRQQVEILHAGGWKPRDIERIMRTDGQPVSYNTIRRWTDPAARERLRRYNRESERRRHGYYERNPDVVADAPDAWVDYARAVALV